MIAAATTTTWPEVAEFTIAMAFLTFVFWVLFR